MASGLRTLDVGTVDHYQNSKAKDEDLEAKVEGNVLSQEDIQEVKRKVSIINKGIIVDVVSVEENPNGGDVCTIKVKATVEAGGCAHFASIKLRFSAQALAKFLNVTKKLSKM